MQVEIHEAISLLKDALAKAASNPDVAKLDVKAAILTLTPLVAGDSDSDDDASKIPQTP